MVLKRNKICAHCSKAFTCSHFSKKYCSQKCQRLANLPVINKIQEKYKQIRATDREKIYNRDGYLCYYCGKYLKNLISELTLDHIYPQSLGGKHTTSNLVTSCKSCNSSKNDKIDIEIINKALEDINNRNNSFGLDSNLTIIL